MPPVIPGKRKSSHTNHMVLVSCPKDSAPVWANSTKGSDYRCTKPCLSGYRPRSEE